MPFFLKCIPKSYLSVPGQEGKCYHAVTIKLFVLLKQDKLNHDMDSGTVVPWGHVERLTNIKQCNMFKTSMHFYR